MSFYSKIGVLGVLGVDNLHKKFWNDILKIVDFFLMSNFWWSFLSFLMLSKTKKIPPKVRYEKKIYNSQNIISNFFVHVVYTQNLHHNNFGAKNQQFSSLILTWKLCHLSMTRHFYKIAFLWNIQFLRFLLYLMNQVRYRTPKYDKLIIET